MVKNPKSQKHLKRLRIAFLITGSAAILLTFALWVGLFFRPFLAGRRQFHREILRVVELSDQKSQIMEQLELLQVENRHWEFLEELRQRRSSNLSNDADFLEWLNRQADLSGVVIRDFRPNSRQLREGYQARGVSLNAHGSFEAICKLLDQIRDCPQMFRITSLDLTARDSEGANMSLSLQGQLLTSPVSQRTTSSNEG